MSSRKQTQGSWRHGSRRWVIALGVVAFGLVLFIRVSDESPDRYVVLQLSEHPPGTAVPYIPKRRHFAPFYVVHTPGGQVYALVRRPPDARCLVVWSEVSHQFDDPCAHRAYDMSGLPIGHGGRPLDRLHLELTDAAQIYIDMGVRHRGPSS